MCDLQALQPADSFASALPLSYVKFPFLESGQIGGRVAPMSAADFPLRPKKAIGDRNWMTDFDSYFSEHLIWHYTNFAGLQGILSGHVWASSLTYLNDKQEFKYGISIGMQILEDELVHHPDSPALQKLQRETKAHLATTDPQDIFVASFSTKKDDLSQWRAYSGSGPMFSIGFNSMSLSMVARQWRFELKQVCYSRTEVEKELREEIADALNDAAYESQVSNDIPPGQITSAMKIAYAIATLAPRLKNHAFSAESEWRLIRSGYSSINDGALERHFRQAGSLVVPFLKLPLELNAIGKKHNRDRFSWMTKLMDTFPKPNEVFEGGSEDSIWTRKQPIEAIMIGPSPHHEELRAAVRAMAFDSIKLAPEKIEMSQIPFRNW
jgi:Protein of unknown function (DUF2971)